MLAFRLLPSSSSGYCLSVLDLVRLFPHSRLLFRRVPGKTTPHLLQTSSPSAVDPCANISTVCANSFQPRARSAVILYGNWLASTAFQKIQPTFSVPISLTDRSISSLTAFRDTHRVHSQDLRLSAPELWPSDILVSLSIDCQPFLQRSKPLTLFSVRHHYDQ